MPIFFKFFIKKLFLSNKLFLVTLLCWLITQPAGFFLKVRLRQLIVAPQHLIKYIFGEFGRQLLAMHKIVLISNSMCIYSDHIPCAICLDPLRPVARDVHLNYKLIIYTTPLFIYRPFYNCQEQNYDAETDFKSSITCGGHSALNFPLHSNSKCHVAATT
jgi:hypothetical protein